MRLRLGRGLPRHNLQSFMDFEDFMYNRTNATPSDVFKKLGDIASIYCRSTDDTSQRHSVNSVRLNDDTKDPDFQGLSLDSISTRCSASVFQKAARYEVKSSTVISTQCYPEKNTITGEFRGTRINDQVITWSQQNPMLMDSSPTQFNNDNFAATCTCRYFKREQIRTDKLCSHIVGQLRRVVYLTH